MDENNRDSGMAVCYACNNRWTKQPHEELRCPVCESEFIEILDEPTLNPEDIPSDPEEDDIDDFDERLAARFGQPQDHGHGHDHDHAPPGAGGGGGAAQGPLGGGILGNFASMLGSILGGPHQYPQGQPPRQQPVGGEDGQAHAGGPQTTHREWHGPGGSVFTYTSTVAVGGGAGFPGRQRMAEGDDLNHFMNTFFMPPDALGGHTHGPGMGPPNPLAMLFGMLDPRNQRAGDAVFSQEALDRVISDLMEQNQSGSAPPPASEDAISHVPKVPLTQSMIDGATTADCSICMDEVKVGDEVMRLYCTHWFHPHCIEMWLNEHNTCPHCRKTLEQSKAESEGRKYEPAGQAGQAGNSGSNSQAGNSRSNNPPRPGNLRNADNTWANPRASGARFMPNVNHNININSNGRNIYQSGNSAYDNYNTNRNTGGFDFGGAGPSRRDRYDYNHPHARSPPPPMPGSFDFDPMPDTFNDPPPVPTDSRPQFSGNGSRNSPFVVPESPIRPRGERQATPTQAESQQSQAQGSGSANAGVRDTLRSMWANRYSSPGAGSGSSDNH